MAIKYTVTGQYKQHSTMMIINWITVRIKKKKHYVPQQEEG